MRVRTILFCSLVQALPTIASAQLSAYSSVSYGYHHNPLYTYLREGDQLTQSYFEFGYLRESGRSRFNVQYVSGLVLFNRFRDRSFYEHSLTARYTRHSPGPQVLAAVQRAATDQSSSRTSRAEMTVPPDSTDESESDSSAVDSDSTSMNDTTSVAEEQNENDENTVVDSSGSFWGVSAKVAARLDRELFQELDSQGFELGTFYRTTMGETLFLRLNNNYSYRQYPNLGTLSNMNDMLGLEFGYSPDPGFAFGALGSVGFKYYTESQYDTTLFQSPSTFNQNPTGRGKGGGILENPSGKRILIQPTTNGTLELAFGSFLRSLSPSTRFTTSVLFRRIPRSSVRYLAQTTGTSLVSEDAYNDQFSYEGLDIRVRLEQNLFWKVRGIAEASLQQKHYEGPALDLSGTEIDSRRKDSRSEIEFYISRFFGLYGDLGVDFFVSAAFVRNQSNDNYNDYSFSSFSFGVGIGF